MRKFLDLPLHKRRIYSTLKSFSVLPFFLLPMPKSIHMWPQLDNEFPYDFHNYTGLNGLVNSFS